MKILIIGSKDHERAKCVEWMEPFPNIEEYDLVIIDFNTLDQPLLQKFVNKQNSDTEEIRSKFLTLLKTGRNIICIFSEVLVEKKESRYVIEPRYNYDIIPVRPNLNKVEGDSRDVFEKEFAPYFNKVKKWKYELTSFSFSDSILFNKFRVSELYNHQPIALNKSKKYIATKLQIINSREKGSIYFIPKVTECEQDKGIEILLDIFVPQQSKPKPTWLAELQIPGKSEMEEKKHTLTSQIRDLQKEYEKIIEKETQLEEYTNLLTEDGDKLVTIVQRVLQDLDIKTEKTIPGFPVDLLAENKIAIEITGTNDKIDSDTDKILQILQFKEKHYKGEKMVIIANTYKKEPFSKRSNKLHFTKEVVAYLKLQKVCCISTTILWNYWIASVKNSEKIKDFKNKLFSTDGEIEFLQV